MTRSDQRASVSAGETYEEPAMIVSRRSYLMTRPSLAAVRCATGPVSPARTEAERRFADLLRRTGAKAD